MMYAMGVSRPQGFIDMVGSPTGLVRFNRTVIRFYPDFEVPDPPSSQEGILKASLSSNTFTRGTAPFPGTKPLSVLFAFGVRGRSR